MFYLGTFCFGLICGIFLMHSEDKIDKTAESIKANLIAELQGYLKTKPLLNEAERSLLSKVAALHDLD